MSAKLTTPAPLEITVFSKNGYGTRISVHIINKILSCDSNYIVDMVMCLKFGKCTISMREVITSIKNLAKKFIEGCSWFK